MRKSKGVIVGGFLLALCFLVFVSGAWGVERGVRSPGVAGVFASRILRGHRVPSVGSPGGGVNFSPSGSTSSSGNSSLASSGSNGASSNSNNSSLPANINFYLNLLGVSINGQDILQGNTLTSAQLALLTQSASADLIALNIANIIQNNIQLGLNINVSPIVNVVVYNALSGTAETPVNIGDITVGDVNVGPIDISVEVPSGTGSGTEGGGTV
jgi:hypothetical protein